MKRLVSVLAAATLAIAGCSSSKSNNTGGTLSGSLTVYAASSLTEAFNAIKAQFIAAHPGTSITFNFGASSDLATQITQGASVDVFASASSKIMQQVVTAGDAAAPTDFVKNTLEIAVPPSNPGKIASVADLAKSGIKVAVCDPSVPCGTVARQVFTNAKITVKPVANEADVKSTLNAVESGEVDAGLVYVTDVRAAGSKVKGIQIPDSINASTTYPIVALSKASNSALAQAFVAYVLSGAGKTVLTADGFKTP